MLALAFLADFNEYTRRASGLPDFSLGTAALVSLLRVPNIMQVAIPFVILSAMSVLAALNKKYELVVVRAAGVSAWQFLTPLLFASFLIGVLMTTFLTRFPHGFYPLFSKFRGFNGRAGQKQRHKTCHGCGKL